MNYLDSLNAAQLDAVQTTEGPLRVLAGAGTGKTRALTARYCYLVDLLGIDPSAILCVTFTNKAAAEMKGRIRHLLGDFDPAFICTFHSFCVRLLKEDIHVLSYPSAFVILDEDDQAQVLQKVYSDLGLTLKELPIRRSVDYIAQRKGDEAFLEIMADLGNEKIKALTDEAEERLEKIFLHYLYEQKKNFALDFDDIIIYALHILSTCPDVLRKWQERMQYVMVDEFQDVSRRQYAIARLLAGQHRNLFIVGDPDQTIYSWRGADVNFFLDFDKLYADAATIVLSSNYRSTPQILAATNSLIAKNRNRYPKELKAHCGEGAKPLMYHARNERDEAGWIARTIKGLVADGCKPSTIAVLYRAHHLSRTIEDALLRYELPYVIYSGTAFYGRREVKDVLAYLRMLLSADDIAFVRTVNTPSRKIGRKKMALIQAHADAAACSMFEALQALASSAAFARTGAKSYIEAIEDARKLLGHIALGDLVQHILDTTGYEQMLRQLSQWERLDNLAELKRAIEEDGHDDDATLEAFLTRAALIANIDRDSEKADTIKLMTVHTAKGMEFDNVVVAGLNEGNFPSRRCNTPEELEEERRLAYVAATRAKQRLFLCDSEGYSHDGTDKETSRFVYEMELGNLQLLRPLKEKKMEVEPLADNGGATFTAGTRVEHPVFGKGTVTEASTEHQRYTVLFDSIPTPRTLRFGAPLDPVSPRQV